MSQAQLFSGVPDGERVTLAAAASLKDYQRDDFLFEQGQPLRSIILIQSGCIKLTQLSSDGSEVILWLHGCQDAVGVFGIPSSATHTCSARALARSRVLVWDWFRLERGPSGAQIRRNIGHIVSERLGELEERFREVATEKVTQRVARAVIRMLKSVGRAHAEGIEISLSREELAQLTGTTLFTVSRLISRWNELGIVKPRREGFVVRNAEMLQQISVTCE